MVRWIEYKGTVLNLSVVTHFHAKESVIAYSSDSIIITLEKGTTEEEAQIIVRDIIEGKYDMKTPPVRIEDVLEMWKHERKEALMR